MPMGIVSDADFEKELTRNPASDGATPKPTVEVVDLPRGRGQGSNGVPDSLRKIIGETSEIDGRTEALQLAAAFGVSPSSVSAYANGSTSTATMDRQPNLDHINDAKGRVAKRARIRLMSALQHITPDKLKASKAIELALVAKNMSAVIKEMEPEQPKSIGGGNVGPTYVFYAPVVKQEEHYDIVFAKE